MKVAVLGAFGFRNTGDQLIGMATKQLLKEINSELTVDLFSIHPFFTYTSKKIEDIQFISRRRKKQYEEILNYDALIIGGGALLLPMKEFETFLLLEDHNYPKLAWNAMGSQYTPTHDKALDQWYDKLSKAVEKLDYISVRSYSTKRLLERVGGNKKKIYIVPDAAHGLVIEEQIKIAEGFIEKMEIKPGDKLIGISIGPEIETKPLDYFQEQLLVAIKEIKACQPNTKIVVFPFGDVYGDSESSRRFAELLPESSYFFKDLSAKETWSLVGTLDVYMTVRYHGVIAGISQGIPTIMLDCYLSNGMLGSKIMDIATQNGLDAYYLSPIISICERPETRNFIHTIDETNDLSQLIRKKIDLAFESKKFWKDLSIKLHQEVRDHFKRMYSKLEIDKGIEMKMKI